MATKTFVHLNGVSYELAAPYDDQALQQLAKRIEPTPSSQSGSASAPFQILDVVINGTRASLTVAPGRIWASGVFRAEGDGSAWWAPTDVG